MYYNVMLVTCLIVSTHQNIELTNPDMLWLKVLLSKQYGNC